MELPVNFQWINDIGVLPKMVQEGLKILGTKEIKGVKNNSVIMEIVKELGVEKEYTSDDKQPWCAIAHCGISKRAGKLVNFKDRWDYLRALSFIKLEDNGQWLRIYNNDAMFGDTVIFKRPGGGHLGLYIGESKTHIYVLGGNQNDMYSFTRVDKDRLYAVLRPKYNIMPESVKKYMLEETGTPATHNEV